MTKVIFRPIKCLKLIGIRWLPERSTNLYSVSTRENSRIAITRFCIVYVEAVAFGLDDVSNSIKLFGRLRNYSFV